MLYKNMLHKAAYLFRVFIVHSNNVQRSQGNCPTNRNLNAPAFRYICNYIDKYIVLGVSWPTLTIYYQKKRQYIRNIQLQELLIRQYVTYTCLSVQIKIYSINFSLQNIYQCKNVQRMGIYNNSVIFLQEHSY